MTVIRHNRRQFLRGVGGFTLALPFLPSLVEKASAQAYVHKPRLVMLATQHGAIRQANMFPAASTAFDIFSDHQGRQSKLARSVANGRASLTSILSAPDTKLTDRLVSKMNVLRGVDIAFYISHHTGGHLGNFARNDGNLSQVLPRPTIDQILAWSPSFYKDLSTNRMRSMHIGGSGNSAISWGFSNPSARSGGIQAIPTSFSTKELFDKIFVPPPTEGVSTRIPVVDRVLDSYKRLRDGSFGDAQRLSASDRQRLDDHMQRLSELERRVNVVVSCGDVAAPKGTYDNSSVGARTGTTDVAATRDYYQAYNDVVVAAFICGTSRIATMQVLQTWAVTSRDWHQEVAHVTYTDPAAETLNNDAHRNVFEHVVVDLASKLDAVEEAEGRTYLDNTLLWWGQESGFSTHNPISLPIVTFGSAAGYFKTGYSVDYRRLNGPKWPYDGGEYAGVLYNQWLANVLMAMGVQRAEYGLINLNDKGYGSNYRQAGWGDAANLWPDRLYNAADSALPFLKA